jgi:hypothetical protein
MDNLHTELPRKLDAATIAALFPDLDAVKSRVANWLHFLDRGIPPKLVHEALECASMLQVPQVFSYSFDEAYRPAADYVQRMGEGPALSRHVSFDPQTFRPAP